MKLKIDIISPGLFKLNGDLCHSWPWIEGYEASLAYIIERNLKGMASEYRDGERVEVIARRHRLSVTTMRGILRSMGIGLRTRGGYQASRRVNIQVKP